MEVSVKVAVTIQEGDLTVKKGHPDGIVQMLNLPLEKKIKSIRVLRNFIRQDKERREKWEKRWSGCKELSDDEFYEMLK